MSSAQSQSTQGTPKLRIYEQMVNHIGGDIGCYGLVDGGVTDTGNADAQNVVVTCTAEQYSVQKDLGSIKSYDTTTFEAIIDYSCSNMPKEECTVTCGNC